MTMMVPTPSEENLIDLVEPRLQDYANLLSEEVAQLRASNRDPVEFAIEAMRINLAMASFMHEAILYEAMEKLRAVR